MKHNITTYCHCGCGEGFYVDFCLEDDSGYVMMSTVTSGFTAERRGVWDTVKKRIKAAWFMLCGKEYVLHEVFLNKKEWNEFVNQLNEFNKMKEDS